VRHYADVSISFFKLAGNRPPVLSEGGSVMWLVRVQPERQGIDKDTFECPVCDLSEKPTVKSEYRSPDNE
jgi:hypothetical protein